MFTIEEEEEEKEDKPLLPDEERLGRRRLKVSQSNLVSFNLQDPIPEKGEILLLLRDVRELLSKFISWESSLNISQSS